MENPTRDSSTGDLIQLLWIAEYSAYAKNYLIICKSITENWRDKVRTQNFHIFVTLMTWFFWQPQKNRL